MLVKLSIIHANDGESSGTNIIDYFETTKWLFTLEYIHIKNHMIKERNAANSIVINLKEERKIAKEMCANLGLKQKGEWYSAPWLHLENGEGYLLLLNLLHRIIFQ